MWFWAMLFFVILMPLVRNVRARKSIIANPTTFLLSVIGLTLIAWLWVSLLIDQIPCFMGVPICD
jgi:predicted PurR-regulated permease PerM